MSQDGIPLNHRAMAGERIVNAITSNGTRVLAMYAGIHYLIALDAWHRCDEDTTGSVDAITSIVFAAAAAEAFINEFTEYVGLQAASSQIKALDDTYKELLKLVARNSRSGPNKKYQLAKQALCGETYDENARTWSDFGLLIDIRNHLVHLRPQQLHPTLDDRQVFHAMSERGLLPQDTNDSISAIARKPTAEFACIAAVSAMRELDAAFERPHGNLNIGELHFGHIEGIESLTAMEARFPLPHEALARGRWRPDEPLA